MSSSDTAARPDSRAHTLLWSVRRELWENRAVYLAPLAAAVIFVVGFVVSLITLPERTGNVFALTGAARHDAILEPYMFAAGLLMATGVVVGVFYSLDALYAERRDRSILFWQSLPVSDVATVLSKASVAIVILPVVTTAAIIAVHFAMLLLTISSLSLQGLSTAQFVSEVAPARMVMAILYHTVTVHILWYAPLFAWLLLASAWARRAPFLYAGIPLLAIVIVERIAFDSSRFLGLLQGLVVGGPESLAGSTRMPIDPLTHIMPGVFFGSPGLWVGLALTVLFLAGAVRIRRQGRPA